MIMDVVTDSDRVDSRPEAGRELMDTIAGIRRVVRRQVGATMRAQSLAPAQLELLLVVEREPGIGVAAAARALHLAGNSVSALVNQLASASLLRRDTDQQDRRAAQLFLTTKATNRLAHWRDTRGEFVAAALARLDPADRTSIEGALPALARLLDDLRGQG
jgi:DNA-binding MarR family transcriptional regulator